MSDGRTDRQTERGSDDGRSLLGRAGAATGDDTVVVIQLAVLALIAFVAAFGAAGLSWPLVAVLALFLAAPNVPRLVEHLTGGDGLRGGEARDLRRAIDDVAGAVDELPGGGSAAGSEEAELAGQLLDYLREDRVIALALVRHRLTQRLAALAEQYGGDVGTLDDPHATAEQLRVEGIVDGDVADAATGVTAALDRALERPDALSRSQTARLLNLGIRTTVHLRALREDGDDLIRRAGAGEPEEDGSSDDG